MMSAATSFVSIGAGVGFIHDDHLRTGPRKVLAAPVRLDVIHRDNHMRVHIEDRFTGATVALKTSGCAWQHEFRVNVELLVQLILPLFSQVWWRENG